MTTSTSKARRIIDHLLEQDSSAVERLYANLVNGNLKDAKRQAVAYTEKDLRVGLVELGVLPHVAVAAARYLKRPSQATFDDYARASTTPYRPFSHANTADHP